MAALSAGVDPGASSGVPQLKQAGLRLDAPTANAHVGRWLTEVTNSRIHATTYERPDRRLLLEREALLPLPQLHRTAAAPRQSRHMPVPVERIASLCSVLKLERIDAALAIPSTHKRGVVLVVSEFSQRGVQLVERALREVRRCRVLLSCPANRLRCDARPCGAKALAHRLVITGGPVDEHPALARPVHFAVRGAGCERLHGERVQRTRLNQHGRVLLGQTAPPVFSEQPAAIQHGMVGVPFLKQVLRHMDLRSGSSADARDPLRPAVNVERLACAMSCVRCSLNVAPSSSLGINDELVSESRWIKPCRALPSNCCSTWRALAVIVLFARCPIRSRSLPLPDCHCHLTLCSAPTWCRFPSSAARKAASVCSPSCCGLSGRISSPSRAWVVYRS